MTTDSPSTKPSFRFQKLGSNLFLGFLVTALSVFTAATNYITYQVNGTASGYDTEGARLLANSNTEYVRATQFIILDYDMYDGYYSKVWMTSLRNTINPIFRRNYRPAMTGRMPLTINTTMRCMPTPMICLTRHSNNLI